MFTTMFDFILVEKLNYIKILMFCYTFLKFRFRS